MATRVLMVCLGNICRSPLAHGLLRSKVDPGEIKVDSAGTSDYHIDQAPDERMIATAKEHHLDITDLRGRQFEVADFDRFDHIFVMDRSNYAHLLKVARSEKDKAKVDFILNNIYPGKDKDVPDPYFGGQQGFEKVYRLLDQATDVLAKKLT